MTLLPIVERELRVAARRRGTYWLRLAVALGAILLATGIFVVTLGATAGQTGRNIFQALAALLLLYCLSYGRRATADSLSQEKREGTLGLLFLTDLKGHDVVLGKMAATSLNGFYGLLAVFPVLAVPLLLGGITNGEFWRMVLVLVNTFLFSLAVGVLGSALSRDFRRAMAANLGFLLLFMAVPPAIGLLVASLPGRPWIPELFFSCPAYSFFLCDDRRYSAEFHDFWWSAAVTFILTSLLVLLASAIVPRSWQDQPSRTSKTRWREFRRSWSYGSALTQSAFRKRLLDVNAFYWLAARVRRKPVHVWTFLAFMAAWWLAGYIGSGRLWLDQLMAIITALMLNFALKVWVTIVAGQQLAEDQKSGAFELLLTAPLSVRDLVRGQMLALRRQFLGPVLATIAIELLLMRSCYVRSHDSQVLVTWLAGIAILIADLFALSWVAMLRALIAKNHNQATLGTLLRVQVLPWALLGIVAAAGNFYYEIVLGKQWSPGQDFYVSLWVALSLGIDLAFGLAAWVQLKTRFRPLALQRFNPVVSVPKEGRVGSTATFDKSSVTPANEKASGSTVFDRQETQGSPEKHESKTRSSNYGQRPARLKKRVAIFCLLVVVVGVGFFVLRGRVAPAPALVVAIAQSNAPLRVFPGGSGALIILPDGSLWRWGAIGFARSRAPVPEQVGTNRDWIQAATPNSYRSVGLRADGSLWEWGNGLSPEPQQADPGHDWLGIAASWRHSVAIRRDGTLWAWGDNSMSQLGNGPGPARTNLMQVGTNHDWTEVSCGPDATLGLRKDGTVWTWGSVYIYSSGFAGLNTVPVPTRICLESNWAGFSSGFSPLLRSRSGDVWLPFFATPNGAGPVSSIARLILSNSLPDRIAVAFCGTTKLYHVRLDGTLWESPFPIASLGGGPPFAERRVGKRHDWQALSSAGGTAFGITSDGTLWTWGFDPSRDPIPGFRYQLKKLQVRVRTFLSPGSPTTGTMAAPAMPPYQKQPRPLLRLVSTNSIP